MDRVKYAKYRFCESMSSNCTLNLFNFITITYANKNSSYFQVTDFLFFLSKLLVTAGVGAVAYIFFATDLISFMNNSTLNYGLVPVVTIMLVTYLISSLFFSVYSMAVDTLFLCFCTFDFITLGCKS